MKNPILSVVSVTAGMTLLLSGCANDLNESNPSIEDQISVNKKAYVNIAVKYPSAGSSRSATDSEGDTNSDASPDFEIGSAEENNVTSALVVLTDINNNYVTYCMVDINDLEQVGPSNGMTTHYKAAFDLGHIRNAYAEGSLEEGGSTNIWVYCNPTQQLLDMVKEGFSGEWMDWSGYWNGTQTENDIIWTDNHFLMTNSTLYTRADLPGVDEWDKHTDENNPYDLTQEIPVPVERVAARFDFKDGSTKGNSTYSITNSDGTSELLTVQLTRMALVNVSNAYYFLRRVSANGLMTNATYGGIETPVNYVVDLYSSEKSLKGEITPENAFDFFNYTLFDNQGNYSDYNWENISDVISTPDDNWLSEPVYSKWHYLTENTIPSPAMNQKTVQTTGIVFEAKLSPGSATPETLQNALNNVSASSPVLYLFDEILYTGFDEAVAAAKSLPAGALYNAVSLALDAAGMSIDNYSGLTVLTPAVKEAMTSNGFTIYEPSLGNDGAWGYYCYYFYWNRHNDNGIPNMMGNMEFAVVRNNVYKISVDTLERLGHPVEPDNDPDPVEPEDPAEEAQVYMTLTIEVLPWVVRVNSVTY